MVKKKSRGSQGKKLAGKINIMLLTLIVVHLQRLLLDNVRVIISIRGKRANLSPD